LVLDGGWPLRALIFTPAQPKGGAVIAIPPETDTAEAFAASPWVTSLVSSGTLVAIPTTVTRSTDHPLSKQLRGRDLRHILHRYAFITGRTLTGLEVEQASALRQYLASRPGVQAGGISVLGGMSALFAAASDPSFASATVLEFDVLSKPQDEPFDRLIYGRLNEFGDAELAALIAPRPLAVSYGPDSGGAQEFARAQRFYRGLKLSGRLVTDSPPAAGGAATRQFPESEIRQERDEQFDGMHRYLRPKMAEADQVRQQRWKLARTPAASRSARAAELRMELAALEGIPKDPPAPLNPRTRLLKVTQNFIAYEAMLGVVDGVDVYGHLLVPRKRGVRLPAVVCQHGLEGQPKDTNGLGEKPDAVYHAFAARLADRGYVVFSPYLTVPVPQDKLINPIVRLAGALGGMRTGMEVRKLRRVVDFLSGLRFVDPARIGYYGLSYGGYSTIWMGSMEPRLKAIIISGHFNHWSSKIANEELATSYMMYADEDFYNWDVLNRFTHPELIAAMWPRAVMVEWAEGDGTTNVEWHERAWKEVADLAVAWGAEDKVVREAFLGKHEIGGMGSFEFLDRWLRPELPPSREYVYAPWPKRELPGLGDRSGDTWPCTFAKLDANPDTFLRSTFRVPPGAPLFRGISVQLSRSGNPGPVVLRFGTKPGMADLGEARISGVHPLYDLWYDAKAPARRLVPGRLYHVEMRAEATPTAEDFYQVWGPKPLGGQARPHAFGFSYRLIGQAKAGEDTHEFVKRYLDEAPTAKLPAGAAS
jgi:dienelactone hydrolase